MNIDWFNDFSTNIAEMDGQHLKLFGFIGRLRKGLEDNQQRKAIEEVLDSLMDYTQDHFSREEQIMQECGFPGLEEHRKEHNRLVDEVKKRRERFKLGADDSATELGAFLYIWLKDHIATVDKKYGEFILDKDLQ